LDLRQLRFFVAVGDEGGVRAAARRLGISQPQISLAVRRLEAELGVQLMHRSPAGIELTPEGEELLRHGQEILDRVDLARTALHRVAEHRTSRLRVGVLAGVLRAGELLAPILNGFRDARPEVALHLTELSFSDQTTAVLDGMVDVAIVRAPLRHPDLQLTPIALEPRVLMLSAVHELAQETSVDVEDVLGFPTLPLQSRTEWSSFWQLNDLRGHSNCAADVVPVSTVPEAQFAIASHDVMISSPASIGRLAVNPVVKIVPLRGASPSLIALIARRGDRRGTVRQFVLAAQATVEREIDSLPGGVLPA
jgi:DNA-binding transcriptional LysR family regulator